ncbi:unnamed protein product [Brassicogethes aeneus]|uniref:Ig-like domain-containing protein n=1 Tax=Brassicogethes aeneus TaxID=1431903 RepID=A0A9P0B5H2_BRAAE|nr:unnamed protein product [Brassicogethes aeneus]
MAQENQTLLSKYLAIFLVVSGYWVVSICTVFINKTLLSDLHLDAPFFINFSQTLITVLICLMKKQLSKMYPDRFSFPLTDVTDWYTIKAILPVSIMFTTMIATNNLCLKYVSVAFYYIGRSLTTIFNVTLTYFILGETTSKRCIFFCLVIIFGFYLGVDQEHTAGDLSVIGTFFGIAGSLSLSLFSILTKKVLPKVNGEIWALSYANNVYATILFLPMMILNGEISELTNYKNIDDLYFWGFITIGGICGFAIGFFTSLQIKCLPPEISFSVHFRSDAQHFRYGEGMRANGAGHLLVPGDEVRAVVVLELDCPAGFRRIRQGQADGHGGASSGSAVVQQSYNARFRYEPTLFNTLTIKDGSNITLNCLKNNYKNKPKVNWEKMPCIKNYQDEECDTAQIYSLKNKNSWNYLPEFKNKPNLNMHFVKNMAGIYRCLQKGKVKKMWILKEASSEIFSVSLDVANTTSYNTIHFTLRCNVSSKLPVQIIWFKKCESWQQSSIKEDGEYYCHIRHGVTLYNTDASYISKLKFYGEFTDSGTYVCVALTNYGKYNKSVDIHVPNVYKEDAFSLFSLFLIPIVLFIPIVIIWFCYFKRKQKLEKIQKYNAVTQNVNPQI